MNRRRDINRMIILSSVVAIILLSVLIGVVVRTISNRNREKDFSTDLSEFEYPKLDSESVSTEIGKSIEEAEEEFEEPVLQSEIIKNENTEKTEKKETTAVANEENEKKVETNKKEDNIELEEPVKGEIIREFAKDSLVFSNTLQEWITHNGIDIKADKTTVVKAAEAGTVSAIKNDPRYGLTVIINHDNGYQTVYANLLTSEFVVKGEKVEKGQTIGTVGNSASFEISDDYHLHFELLRDNEYLDPVIYMKSE